MMAHVESQGEKTKNLIGEITEEQFLKNLYLFMKKRDTPVDRVPNLGFKQIDLFVMFKTVNDLGGYHQVTSHQLWKQVYNTLGGNPRSTSAATCTRRHYEKLLLPYECHLKGVLMSSIPQQLSPKPYRCHRDDDGGQRPSKRRLLSLQLDQGPQNFYSDTHRSMYPLHLHHPHYYHPNTILPPYLPMAPTKSTPYSSMVTKPKYSFQPTYPDSTENVKGPLQQLRELAEQYKSSTGLTEPLNLSVKGSTGVINRNPVSSFSPPSSGKNPKFLNKPSTLYSPHQTGGIKQGRCETQNGESNEEATAFSYPVKAQNQYSSDTIDLTPCDSPVFGPDLTLEVPDVTPKPSSPELDFEIRPGEGGEIISEIEGLNVNLNHILQNLPQQKDGKMEFEVPLSVFRNWLKSCKPQVMRQEVKEHPDHKKPSDQKSWSDLDVLPTEMTVRMNSMEQNLGEALKPRKEASLKSNIPITNLLHSYSLNPFTTELFQKFLPSGEIQTNPCRQNRWLFGQHNQEPSKNIPYTDL